MPAPPSPIQSADHQGHAMTDAPCCGQMDKSDGVASKSPANPARNARSDFFRPPWSRAHPLFPQ